MATTHPIRPLRVRVRGNPNLSLMVEYKPEGASQTFVAGAPVVTTAGLIVEAADPVTIVYGIAVRGGQNATAGTVDSEVIPAAAGLSFWANFVDQVDPGSNAFAAADMDSQASLRDNTANLGAAWVVVDDAGTADCCIMMGNKPDYTPPNVAPAGIAVGDINVRAEFVFMPSVSELLSDAVLTA